MDFFNDIGKRVTSAAKSVQKRTRESVEIGRLNGELRALREERDKLYRSLGETYYTARDGEAGREQLDAIVERLDQIGLRQKDLQAQVDRLSQLKRCAKCGNVVSAEARFCPNCGERIPEDEPEAPQANAQPVEYCPSCGAVRQEGSRFCIVCGKPFAAEAAPAEPAGEGAEEKAGVEITWPEPPAADADPEAPTED